MTYQYELPPLSYPKEALEPHIDALTMEIHHDRHHKAYVDNLNKAIAGNAALEAKSLDALIKDLASVPDNIRGPVRNNGGGHWNHSFFWRILGPKTAGPLPHGKAFSRRSCCPAFSTDQPAIRQTLTCSRRGRSEWQRFDSLPELIFISSALAFFQTLAQFDFED